MQPVTLPPPLRLERCCCPSTISQPPSGRLLCKLNEKQGQLRNRDHLMHTVNYRLRQADGSSLHRTPRTPARSTGTASSKIPYNIFPETDGEDSSTPGETISIVEKVNLDKQPLRAERVTANKKWCAAHVGANKWDWSADAQGSCSGWSNLHPTSFGLELAPSHVKSVSATIAITGQLYHMVDKRHLRQSRPSVVSCKKVPTWEKARRTTFDELEEVLEDGCMCPIFDTTHRSSCLDP